MTTVTRLPNLTQYERIGIDQTFNLADGHAHQLPDPDQQDIVRRLPTIYADGERTRQRDLEDAFRSSFYRLAGQARAIRHPYTFFCQSASQSIDLVAAFLADAQMTVALLQPCFDNLAAILTRRRVPLHPLAEHQLTGRRATETVRSIPADALFVTLPNNPTGFTMTAVEFERLARACVESGKTVIVDWTFRFFDERTIWDQYEMLERVGASYICIEDTGKTWPTLDLKCSILASSADLHHRLVEPHNDLLLNVSPFVLRLLIEYIDDAARRGLDRTLWRQIRANRKALRQALTGSILAPDGADRTISVEWVPVVSDTVCGLDVVTVLGAAGVGILPGDHFYWHDPDLGAGYVRFALARDTVMFASACRRLQDAIATVPALRRLPLRSG